MKNSDFNHVCRAFSCSEILQKLGEIRGRIVEAFGWNTDMGYLAPTEKLIFPVEDYRPFMWLLT